MVEDPVAQLVEHNTFNVGVLGSSPSGITRKTSAEAGVFRFPADQAVLLTWWAEAAESMEAPHTPFDRRLLFELVTNKG